eukprot:8761296-Alexandrium_andersonii.AAC.1
MVIRGAAAFADPQEAHAQVQRNQRVWTGLYTNPARPAHGPMDVNLGRPAPTEDPRARQRQDGDYSGHSANSPPNRGTEEETGKTGAAGSFGLLALMGLIISTV